MLHIYTPENVEEPLVFWYFKGVAEIQHWPEMGYWSTDKWNITNAEWTFITFEPRLLIYF